MKLACEDYDQISVISIRGDLTADQVDPFRKMAQERLDAQTRDIVLDLAEVEFVDSKGLEALLWVQERCHEHLGQVRLARPNESIRKILEMTRLAARLECQDQVEAAVRSLR